ncbi:MAG: CotH kinase family protein [Treponema sp.]|nr:CotH kinase family protein [Treponema sp.]
MSMKKILFVGLFAAAVLFGGCKNAVQTSGGGSGSSGNDVSYPHYSVLNTEDGEKGSSNTSKDVNPIISESRSESLDFIFNTNSLGKTTITISRLEWNQLLRNFDYFYKNENSVLAANYTYEKDGKTWSLNEVGLRLRGNTSRYRPQGKDTPSDESGHHQMNADWNEDYYNYAAKCPDTDYRQSHFKVDFEPRDDDDRKLSGCMKGVALKRMDGSCTREIFCYDLFHRYGIWTAPRASHTKVIIKFIEEDGSITTIDYGVYEMFEEVNKQSLKARDKDENKEANAWKNSKGSLWKCSGGDLSNPNVKYGVEDIRITAFDEKQNPVAFVWDAPTYDLKADKGNLSAASEEFRSFITELNALPNVKKTTDTESINKIKDFYEKWMDVDFFLKTYAVNILVGMDDDYWGNANNYYLYFTDTVSMGRKVYLIPFDYDNTLGASIMKGDGKEGIEQNPFEWGRGNNRPLMDKILQVPEFKEKFRELLLEVSSEESEWNYEDCRKRFLDWKSMVSGSLWTSDLNGNISTLGWWDSGWCPGGYYLTHEPSIYDYTRYQFKKNLGVSTQVKMILDLNGGNIDGDTSSIEVNCTGTSMDLKEIIPTVPEKKGSIFLGWTKTKDGDDYVTFISGSRNITLYARWEDVPTEYEVYKTEFDMWEETSPGKWQNIGTYDEVSMYIEAKEDGLHVKKSHDSKRITMKVKDYSTGKDLFYVENIDRCNGYGETTPINEFVYPFVEKDNIYEIKFEFSDTNYGKWHELKDIRIRAVGGRGDIYATHDGYKFNPEDLTFEFKNLEINTQDASISIWEQNAYFFENKTWGAIINVGGYNGWSQRWRRDESNPNLIQVLNYDSLTFEHKFVLLDEMPSELYAVIRFYFTDDYNLHYVCPLIEEKVYPF